MNPIHAPSEVCETRRDSSSLTRRGLLQAAMALLFCPRRLFAQERGSEIIVNDVHSRLNPTRVHRLLSIDSLDALRQAIVNAGRDGRPICVSGGRHAMGGQQFATDSDLLDLTSLNRILSFDPDRGLVKVQSGICWPALIEELLQLQQERAAAWGIAQKQSGADHLTLGGALAANIHGRGLNMAPFVGDIEAFTLVNAQAEPIHCSRSQNAELFRLAVGGYGLFGIVSDLTLRLAPRRKLQRSVTLLRSDGLTQAFEQRRADGFTYGDYQYMTDETVDDFLRLGVFSCYRPVADDTPLDEHRRELGTDDWRRLVELAHVNKREAFNRYADHYRLTDGQIYWSDLHQASTYVKDYHSEIRDRPAQPAGSEVITEMYVPRPALHGFLEDVREDFRAHHVNLIYGTIRLIDRDVESFLAWARESWACVIFNLHVDHTESGLSKAAVDFRRLIDLALRRGGSYYLTYHRHATRDQVLAGYPQFPEFLRLKRLYDPDERFQSDWYRHYRTMFDLG